MNYSRSWPHTGHVHKAYVCYKNHQRSRLINQIKDYLVAIGAFIVVLTAGAVIFALGVVLVGVHS